VSCLGYCDTTCHHHYQNDPDFRIFLKKEVSALEAVTIVAGKVKEEGTASIAQETLNKDLLLSDPSQSLASALSAIKGVTFTSTGNNIQLPVIHGLYGNRVLILNNGIKHGFQNWGTDHAPEIDVSTANSVTVLKGAAGVRYGPEALGGAIIVEADPLRLNQPVKLQAGTGFQTNGRGYFANAKVNRGKENWSYYLGANYTRIGDQFAPDYSLTNTGKEEISFNTGFRYNLDKLDFKVHYSYLNQNLALLRSSIANSGNAFVKAINSDEPTIIRSFSYDINQPSQLAQHHLGKVEVNWWYANDAKLTFRVGSQLNQREEFDVRRNAELPIIDLDLITNDYQLEWKHPAWFGLDGLIGLQAFTQNNDNNPGTGTTPFIPNYNTTRYSAFAIESFKTNRGTLEIGVRLDHEYNNVRGRETNQDIFTDEFRFTNVTSSFGYIHRISENATFRTNFGTAWRTPNMAELYSFGQHGFKTSFGLLRYYTNEDDQLRTDRVTKMSESEISPERGYKWINEWQLQKRENTFNVTVYTHYIENFIFDRPLAVIGTVRGPMPVFIHDQQDALFVGTDLSWQREWSSAVEGTFNISYLWAGNIEKNEPLINQPPLTTSYQLDWDMGALWKAESSRISIKPSYTFQQFQAPRTVRPEELIERTVIITPESEIFDFRDAPEGYFLLDVAWRLKFGKFDTNLSVQNLLNTSYRNYLNEMRYFADEPGINILFTINYTFNSKST
ncbi:MAG: TonB-dependent receptor, partial [Bacteroidota bacterium]